MAQCTSKDFFTQNIQVYFRRRLAIEYDSFPVAEPRIRLEHYYDGAQLQLALTRAKARCFFIKKPRLVALGSFCKETAKLPYMGAPHSSSFATKFSRVSIFSNASPQPRTTEVKGSSIILQGIFVSREINTSSPFNRDPPPAK